jgi:hypothetical protein
MDKYPVVRSACAKFLDCCSETHACCIIGEKYHIQGHQVHGFDLLEISTDLASAASTAPPSPSSNSSLPSNQEILYTLHHAHSSFASINIIFALLT